MQNALFVLSQGVAEMAAIGGALIPNLTRRTSVIKYSVYYRTVIN